jgi:dTDP-4-dehydrorhamnose reductase
VYSEFGKNFVKTMLKLLQGKDEIKVVNDQVGSPTYAKDLAEVILQIIATQTWQPGIYNYSNDGVISWFDFAQSINELSGSSCKINPIPTSAYPTAAKRPAYSVLDNSKILETFNVGLKGWKESLTACLSRLK